MTTSEASMASLARNVRCSWCRAEAHDEKFAHRCGIGHKYPACLILMAALEMMARYRYCYHADDLLGYQQLLRARGKE